MDPFSEVEEVMEEAAPVDQSSQEIPKGSSVDSTSTLPYSNNVSKPSSPCPSPVVLTPNSPSVIPYVTTPPDIPIKVEYLSDPISVPPPLFHLPRYSSSASTPSFSSVSTLHVPNVAYNTTSANFSGQDVSYSVPLFRSTPLIGSFSVPSQTMTNPCSSSSLSFAMLPPLSSSITHDQNLPSCSFVTPKIIPPFVPTSPTSHRTLSPRKSREGCPVKGKSSRECSSKGKSPRGQGRGSITLSGHYPQSSSGSHNFSSSHTPPIFSQRYFSKDGALDLSTRHRLCTYLPQNPTLKPFFISYSCSPKIFSPIVFFNEPSEYVFNMFSFIYMSCATKTASFPCELTFLNLLPSNSRDRRRDAQAGVLQSSIHCLIGMDPLVVCHPLVDKE